MTDPGLTDHEHEYVKEWCKCGRNEFFDVPESESRLHVLTDLIAAHTTNWERRCLGGDESYLQCDCGDEFEDELSWAAHLKLVVEQHTHGRHEWPKTTPTGFTYDLPTTYADLEHMIGHMVQSEIECWDEPERPPEPVWEMIGIAQQEVGRERARAEKAEATIARVEAEAALLERMIRTAPWSRYTEVRRSHLRSLCAALGRPGDAG